MYQLAFVHAAIGYSPVFSGRLDWTRGHAKRAVELCSQLGRPGWEACSERFHSEAGIARFPLGAGRFERARDAARNALGKAEAAACWEAGGELSIEESVAYARRSTARRSSRRPPRVWPRGGEPTTR